MGISRVSPFLLSVIVMLSATRRALQFLNSVRLDPRTTNGWGRHGGHPGAPLLAAHEPGATCSGTCVAVPAVSVWPAGGITWTVRRYEVDGFTRKVTAGRVTEARESE